MPTRQTPEPIAPERHCFSKDLSVGVTMYLPSMGDERTSVDRIRVAAEELEVRYAFEAFEDEDADAELRKWIDGADAPLNWTLPDRVTADEWFFVSTLYGEMTLEGQRTHIRKYYPGLFVQAAGRDIRTFRSNMDEYGGLRSAWMKSRLAKMGQILRGRRQTMEDYAEHLRSLEEGASADDPTPALDAIVEDHQATGWKTLSVFIRDCVGGNSFPIDSRVQKELDRHGLPNDERQLIGLSLAIGRDPKRLARMFYTAGGDRISGD